MTLLGGQSVGIDDPRSVALRDESGRYRPLRGRGESLDNRGVTVSDESGLRYVPLSDTGDATRAPVHPERG